jgi:SecD/SecF fusion protein
VSDRRKYLILLGAILAAVVAAAFVAIPGSPAYQKPTLGLDLQGGLEVILKAVPPKGHDLLPEDLDRSVSIMESRINALGVTEPEIRKQGKDQIVIQLAGVHNQAKAAALIGKTAQLMLFDFEEDLVDPSVDANGNPRPSPSLYSLLKEVQSQAKTGEPESFYLFKSTTVTKKATKKGAKPTTTVKHSLVDNANTQEQLLQPFGGKVPANHEVLKVPANRIVVSCAASDGCLGAQTATPTGSYYYLMKYYPDGQPGGKGQIPEMTGEDLVLSGTRADYGTNGLPVVLLQFTNKGSDRFQQITREEALRGKTKYDLSGQQGDYLNYVQHFAIVLDQKLESTPYIDFKNTPDGIPGPNAQIDMGNGGSFQEAKDLALVLQTGALPVSFEQIERSDVSATLGKESLTQAWHAAIAGLVVVALFLLVFYRFLGLVAVLGLAIYSLLYYATVLLFNVTLTLPGFAGLVLTIGVAADANVVVFERIKEEVRAGRSVRAAVATGYARGFHTIVDANVVTAITAMILFLIAVASVKGFALMLLLGTVISMITAVVATRALLGLLSGFKWFHNPRFMGASGESVPRWAQIDVASRQRRRVLLSIATAVIVASILVIVIKGLNFGIDFKGGTQMSFKTAQPQLVSDVSNAIDEQGAVVQGRGSSVGERYSEFQIRMPHLTNEDQSRITDALRNQVAVRGGVNTNTVSSSFSSQIARDAILALLVSFLLISVYIALRFQWRFAVPILRTLFNDILITVGFYALSGREVSVATVAAVLTVLGYSIYDTIIVFDRVRENIPLMPRSTFAQIANVSVAETLRRSAATTFITLMPIISLFVLGGETLKDFAFALLVGIGLGAFSTIFVAVPFLTVLMERSPEFRRRSGSELLEGESIRKKWGRAGRAEPVEEPAAVTEAPVPAAPIAPVQSSDGANARREQRRQRRRTRPHGRAR